MKIFTKYNTKFNTKKKAVLVGGDEIIKCFKLFQSQKNIIQLHVLTSNIYM